MMTNTTGDFAGMEMVYLALEYSDTSVIFLAFKHVIFVHIQQLIVFTSSMLSR